MDKPVLTVGTLLASARELITNQTIQKARSKFPADPVSFASALASAYKNRVEVRYGTLQYDEATKGKIEKISRWITDPTTKTSLILYGSVGTGKSTLIYALVDTIEATKSILKNKVNPGDCVGDIARLEAYPTPCIVSAQELANSGAASQQTGSDLFWRYKNKVQFLVIDDLGCEPAVVKNFGTEITPVMDVIYARYNNNLPTIITTNLDFPSIKKIYGERIADRITEVYEKLAFNQRSYRDLFIRK